MKEIPGIPYIYKLFWIDIQVWYFPFKTIKFSNSQLLHCKTEMIQIRVIPNFFVHPAFTKIYPESWFLGLFFDKDRYILYALRKFTHIYKTN